MFVQIKHRMGYYEILVNSLTTQNRYIRKKTEFSGELGTGISEKLDEGEIPEMGERVIFFGDENKKKVTSEGISDQSAKTSDYIQSVNAHLADRIARIEKLKSLDKDFESSIKFLQTGVSLQPSPLDNIPHDIDDQREVKELIQCLVIEQGITKIEFEYLENKIIISRKQLESQENELEKKKEEILKQDRRITELQKKYPDIDNAQKNENKTSEKDAKRIIEEELSLIGKKYDVKKLADAIKELSS